jgi:E3 ubiquitin-protein ligase HUWE1
MLREPTMQQVISLLIISMSNYVVWNDFMNIVVSYPEFPDPEWLTTLFLILEVGLAQADEPKKVPSASDEQDSKSEVEDSPDIFSHVSRTGLLRNCVDILKLEKLNQDNLVSVLRVIVRLTKHHSSAKMFLEIGGLDVIFRRPRTGLEAIKIQQAYIIMILRNIMEDESLLKSLMQEWFTFWFEIRPSPNLTVESFLKTGSNVVLRDPDVFAQVSCKMLRLNKQQHIRYVGDKVEFPEDYLKAEYSPVVINYLLNEFVQVRSQEEKEDDNITIAYTGFLLQCILELVTSYHACKHDVIQFGSQSSTDDKDNGRIRQSILYTFINDLLPYNAINPSTDKARKKQGISMWTTSILVALCYDNFTNQPTDKVPRAELSQVRKHVLDVLSRSFKDTIQSTNISASAKYIKYFSLAELCHRILNARPTTITSQSNKEDTVFTLAQLMLDKGFVPILTSAIGDVDVSYPHAKMILNSILRPLEQLTKLANRLDRSAKNENKGDGKEEEEDDNYSLMDMDEVEDFDAVEEEASNLFRNSSLAMFDGTVLEEEESSEEDSDDEMASSGEEEIATSDEHEYNTASDGFNTESDDDEEDEESDTDDDDDDDEDSEDMEMDELMRSHRYHHTDTEEEEVDVCFFFDFSRRLSYSFFSLF